MNKKRTYRKLPDLARGRVHEISGDAGLLFALLGLGGGPALLCGPPQILGALNPDGLARILDPLAVTLAICPLAQDACWTMETALRDGSIGTCVLLSYRTPGLTIFRRFQLAAKDGNSMGLVVTSEPSMSSAAETRWHCSPRLTQGANVPFEKHFDLSTVNVSLYKNKKGVIGRWNTEIDCGAHPVSVDAAFAGEPVCPQRRAG